MSSNEPLKSQVQIGIEISGRGPTPNTDIADNPISAEIASRANAATRQMQSTMLRANARHARPAAKVAF